MNTVELRSLPKFRFAHIYQAEQFRNVIPPSADFIEVSYVAEGDLSLQVGEKTFTAGKGDILCMLHQERSVVNAPAYHCHHTVGVAAEWAFTDGLAGGLYLPPVTRAGEGTDGICHLIDGFIHRQSLYRESDSRCAAGFLQLLCEIDKYNRRSGHFRLPGDQLYAQRAREFVQQHIHEPITQNTVAEHLEISPGYLCSVFKNAEGTTLMRYINMVKLEGIRALMESEHVHLYEAAALYGYTDPNYVSRLYRRIFGYNITDRPTVHPPL